MEQASVSAPAFTREKNIVVSGTTAPGAEITVYDNDTAVSTAKANSAGSWSVQTALAEPLGTFSYHFLRAEITGAGFDQPVYTGECLVTYDSRTAEASKIYMYNTDPYHKVRETVFDFTDPSTTVPHYTFDMSYPTFSFKVEVAGNANVSKVTVVTVNNLGERTYIPTTYQNGYWVGSHDFDSFTVPAKVGATVTVEGADTLPELPKIDEEKAAEEFNAVSEAIVDTIVENFDIKVDDEDADDDVIDASMTYEEDGETLTAANITVSGGDLDSTVTAQTLESEGYIRIDSDSGDLWMLCNASEDGSKCEITYVDLEARARMVQKITLPEGPEKIAMIISPMALSPESGIMPTALPAWFNPLYLWDIMAPMIDGIKDTSTLMHSYLPALNGCYGNLNMMLKRCSSLINARCDDGTFKLSPGDYESIYNEIATINGESYKKYMKGYNLIINSKNDVFWLSVGQSLLSMIPMPGFVESPWPNVVMYFVQNLGMSVAGKYALTSTLNQVDIIMNDLRGYFDECNALSNSIVSRYKDCNPKKEPEDDPPFKEAQGEHDPSGVVYEAVPSNRLEGVKATIYYLDDGKEVPWNAADFDQINPQITGAAGYYRWDVPAGNWLVRFEKEGYKPADTSLSPEAQGNETNKGWLPVPPPQFDIDVAMVSTAAPTVLRSAAYTDWVQVDFSQYMDIESVTAAIKADLGEDVGYDIVPLNAEEDESGEHTYASSFAVKPREGELEGTVSVTVAAGAENYAGKALAADYASGELEPSVRPESIGHPATGKAAVGADSVIKITLEPGISGAVLEVENLAEELLRVDTAQVTTGEDGRTVIKVHGLTPGLGYIRVTDTASGLTEDIPVAVSLLQPVTARLENGTVLTDGMTIPQGSRVILETASEGAQIRYTLNDTCPCTPEALTYTGPITITSDTVLRAASLLDGEYSATIRMELHVSAAVYQPSASETVTVESSANGTVTAEPASAGEGQTVTVTVTPDEGYITKSVTVTTASGGSVAVERTDTDKWTFTMPSGAVTVKASFATPGEIFRDLDDGAWYRNDAAWAVNVGVILGVDDDKFAPGGQTTRAQAAAMLYRLAGSPEVTDTSGFSDVPEGAWYSDAVAWASSAGIVKGFSEDIFGPGKLVTREQLAAMLWRFAKEPAASETALEGFADADSVSAYARDAVRWAVEAGVIVGDNDRLSPKANALRIQVAAMLHRFMTEN